MKTFLVWDSEYPDEGSTPVKAETKEEAIASFALDCGDSPEHYDAAEQKAVGE